MHQARHALDQGEEAENLQYLLHAMSLAQRTPRAHRPRGGHPETEVPVRARPAASKVSGVTTLVDDPAREAVERDRAA
ncbi:hypothetical protein GCM10010303_00460 [Streptomyces purpurascens]|nr:hypothetical protein GCM10010303_00460 [Streptomyces purpurascens]